MRGDFSPDSSVISELVNQSIEKMLTQLSASRNVDVRVNYAKAMVMATRLWRDTQGVFRRPCSPRLIKDVTRFSYETQEDYGLVINKTNAFAFLNNMGKIITSESSFKKKYSNDKTSSRLVRVAASVSNNTLVCTYAEWLYLEDFPYEPELPEELLELLPWGWECPDPETPGANLPLTSP